MKLFQVFMGEIFIVATGIAAFFHSTWSLGTLFAGVQPDPSKDGILSYLLWVGPGALIAFALDVGQIMTSHRIRSGERTKARYATFVMLAFSTYYLQWLYIAHHMPALQLAPGVRESWGGFATLVRDAAIWIAPLLLPLSTILYTLSGQSEKVAPAAPVVLPESDPGNQSVALVPVPIEATVIEATDDDKTSRCPYCDWDNTYDTPGKARQALASHIRRVHGEKLNAVMEPATNGRYK